jgi:hypothetical protein
LERERIEIIGGMVHSVTGEGATYIGP